VTVERFRTAGRPLWARVPSSMLRVFLEEGLNCSRSKKKAGGSLALLLLVLAAANLPYHQLRCQGEKSVREPMAASLSEIARLCRSLSTETLIWFQRIFGVMRH
jgi:hypothetical protein